MIYPVAILWFKDWLDNVEVQLFQEHLDAIGKRKKRLRGQGRDVICHLCVGSIFMSFPFLLIAFLNQFILKEYYLSFWCFSSLIVSLCLYVKARKVLIRIDFYLYAKIKEKMKSYEEKYRIYGIVLIVWTLVFSVFQMLMLETFGL